MLYTLLEAENLKSYHFAIKNNKMRNILVKFLIFSLQELFYAVSLKWRKILDTYEDIYVEGTL